MTLKVEWLQSYLSNRQQYVHIHKTKSNNKHVACGIQQGSILGPLLCIIYVHDSGFRSSPYNIVFTDDTTVTIKGDNESVVINNLKLNLRN